MSNFCERTCIYFFLNWKTRGVGGALCSFFLGLHITCMYIVHACVPVCLPVGTACMPACRGRRSAVESGGKREAAAAAGCLGPVLRSPGALLRLRADFLTNECICCLHFLTPAPEVRCVSLLAPKHVFNQR